MSLINPEFSYIKYGRRKIKITYKNNTATAPKETITKAKAKNSKR